MKTETTFTKQTIGDYKVTVITTRNGSQLFIQDKEGWQVYAHRVSGDALERAREVIAQLTGAEIAEPQTAVVAVGFIRSGNFGYAVQSRTHENRCHVVEQHGNYFKCSCNAYRFRKTCNHIPQVVSFLDGCTELEPYPMGSSAFLDAA